MPLLLFVLSLSMAEIRVDAFSDTTVKLVSLYPKIEGVDTLETLIFQLTNKERVKKGLNSLKFDYRLKAAARQHSDDMLRNRYLSHGSSNVLNKTPSQRIYNSGLPILRVGENVAEDIGDLIPFLFEHDLDSLAKRVVRGWMESPGHRKNILGPDFTHMGIGSILRGETHKVTQNFAGCTDFMVDSVLAEVDEGKCLLLFYMSSFISDITVFDDGKSLEEDSLYLHSGLIGVPLMRDSKLHKIELCLREEKIYRCGVKLLIHTGSPVESIFPPASGK